MDCKHMQNLLIDFIDKKLDRDYTSEVKSHLSSCKSCQNELEETLLLLSDLTLVQDQEPPIIIKEKFLQNLNEEKIRLQKKETIKLSEPKKTIWLYNPYSQLAAGFAILISGIFLGFLLNKQTPNTEQVALLQDEISIMKQTLFMAKLDQPSASQRIQAVNNIQEFQRPNSEIIEALILTMDTDDNINVRMASIHALSKFPEDAGVREALVNSLKNQEDALLQITLINILVEIQEEKAMPVMRDLLEKDETIEAVKQMAEKGLTTFI